MEVTVALQVSSPSSQCGQWPGMMEAVDQHPIGLKRFPATAVIKAKTVPSNIYDQCFKLLFFIFSVKLLFCAFSGSVTFFGFL